MQRTTEQARTTTRDPSSQSGDVQPSATTFATQPFREPRSFAGQAGEDVEEWLIHYERVSRYNRWDSVAKLANVVFFLTQTALLWFENHEDTLTTWERFVAELKECFGDTNTKRKLAEQTLAQRAQVVGETCTTYIEAVLKLCKTTNSRMTEEDKVGHLLKGIAEDVYQFLIAKDNLTSVSDVIRHCRTFETLKTRRITPKFGRLANVTTVASVEETPSQTLLSTIREIVRDELLRRDQLARPSGFADTHYPFQAPAPAWPSMNTPPSVNVTDFVYRDNLDPSRLRCDTSYQQFPYHQRSDPGSSSNRTTRRPPVTYTAMETPSRYSTRPTVTESYDAPVFERPVPVCYRCGVAGHISRYCNNRPSPRYHRTTSVSDGYWPPNLAQRSLPRNEGMRSRSPASDRSVTPPPSFRLRRSPSPRRRSASPLPEN